MFDRMSRILRSIRATPPVELPVREAYARWAPSYAAEAHNRFMQVEQEALLDLLPDVAGAIVLDLACGTGRYSKIARARGAAAAIGLDLSPEMLRTGAAVATGVARGDLASLPFRTGAAGVVICGLAVGHLRQLDGAIGEMGRVLASRGTLLYSDFHPSAYRAGLRRTFSAGGARYAVEHHVHSFFAHQAACRAAGLEIDAVRELGGGNGVAAVLVIRARRRGR
jgi:malonyl-CoA O-methyltransferase